MFGCKSILVSIMKPHTFKPDVSFSVASTSCSGVEARSRENAEALSEKVSIKNFTREQNSQSSVGCYRV